MFSTCLTRSLGIEYPIINAGMAFVAGPRLAAAVSNAGGLGMLGGAMVSPPGLGRMIRQARALTNRPFGIDLIGDFFSDEHCAVLVEEPVPVVVFFWTAPSREQVARLQAAGSQVWMQVGSQAEARAAAALGVEALIVQGQEAGGHNRSTGSTLPLLASLASAVPGIPLIAAGGIVDGATLVAALDAGAVAAWCGTRFLASVEADAHQDYKRRVIAAGPQATTITTVFGPEWPDQPVRALVNQAVRAARDAQGNLPGSGDRIGSTLLEGVEVPVVRYSALLPTIDFEADLEWACLTAGTAASDIRAVLPAAEIIQAMMAEARVAAGHLTLA